MQFPCIFIGFYWRKLLVFSVKYFRKYSSSTKKSNYMCWHTFLHFQCHCMSFTIPVSQSINSYSFWWFFFSLQILFCFFFLLKEKFLREKFAVSKAANDNPEAKRDLESTKKIESFDL